MADGRATVRFQFSLRALLVTVLISIVCVVNWRSLFELSFGPFWLVVALFGSAAWWAGQRYRSRSTVQILPRFSMSRVLLPITFLAFFFSLWIRHRWLAIFDDDAWPRAFPYPDEIMWVFHNWLDSRYPATPGSFKIHGEFDTVWRYLNLTALGLCTVFGTNLGLACRTSGPLGTRFWRANIVIAYRKLTADPPMDADPQIDKALLRKTAKLYRGMGWAGIVYSLVCAFGMVNALTERQPQWGEALGMFIVATLAAAFFLFLIKTANHLGTTFDESYRRARWLGIIAATLFFPILTVPGILAVHRLERCREHKSALTDDVR